MSNNVLDIRKTLNAALNRVMDDDTAAWYNVIEGSTYFEGIFEMLTRKAVSGDLKACELLFKLNNELEFFESIEDIGLSAALEEYAQKMAAEYEIKNGK